jgi:hypothetical protein
MGKPANITLAAARARVRQIHPRVLMLNALLFQAAGLVVASLWTAAVCLSNGWGLLPGVLLALGAAAGTGVLWLLWTFGWLLQSGLSGVQRMTRGWMTAVAVVALVGAAVVTPWWAAIGAALLGLGASPLLAKMARSVDGTKVTSWGLPKTLLPVLQGVPERLPVQVESILDTAFRDWMHLRDLVGFTADSALRSYVDMSALSRDAERTVLYLMRRAPVVAKLVDLSNERGELAARRAAETAVHRLRRVGEVLHEAVTAASQFAASEEREEAHELKIRVEGLKELASSLEVDGLEVELSHTTLEDPRFRVSELMPEPQVRVAASEAEPKAVGKPTEEVVEVEAEVVADGDRDKSSV